MAFPAAPRNRIALPLFLLSLAVLCGPLCAQTSNTAQNGNTITVRMLDSRTGHLIATTNFLVRVNHLQESHGDWVKPNEDGTGNLTLPANAEVITVHATYDSATHVYSNCDADKDHGSADHAAFADRWYPIALILSSGVVAPNECVGKKVPERLQVVAKPGEFVFFVRFLKASEEFRD